MKITITFLAPTFLYGADQTKPEFRIPSLLGQMRYWWRMTRKWGTPDAIATMRKRESEVFGLSDLGAKSFCMWVTERKLTEKTKTAKEQTRRDKVRYMFDTNRSSGLSYLFYPFNNRKERFAWFTPGAEVHLEMDFLKEEEKPDVLLSLYLLSCFGGLGARSRRGGGAVEISSPDCALLSSPREHPVEHHLVRYVRGEDRRFQEYFSLIDLESPLWKALSQPESRYGRYEPRGAADPIQVLDSLGSRMQQFRTKQGLTDPNQDAGNVDPDFRTEAIELHKYYNDYRRNPDTSAPPSGLSKDAFGLPRIINFTSGKPIFNALTIAPFRDGEPGRRASPLHMTVNRQRAGSDWRYYATLLVLWDGLDFLPSDQGLDIRIKHESSPAGASHPALENPGPEKLEKFMRRMLS